MTYFCNLWILTIIINILRPVLVQFAIPMFQPPPPPPPPPMFPIAVPLVPIPIPFPKEWEDELSTTTTTTTTTTTQRPQDQVAFGFPFPVPMPMPIPMPIPQPILPAVPPNSCQGPPPRPLNCPPCPPCVCMPSCTPAFFSFCSPCHQKCRCKHREDSPRPLPPASVPLYAMQIRSPPVVVLPLPPGLPKRPPKMQKPRYSSYSADSSDTSSEEFDLRSRKSKKRRKINLYRRSVSSYESENELVKPMLSYVARNGEIKFETKIDGHDVAQLLGEDQIESNRARTVHVVTRGDEGNKRDVAVLSKNENKRKYRLKNKKVYLRSGVASHVLGDGKKELLFKPSGDKKISNLSLTFQIS